VTNRIEFKLDFEDETIRNLSSKNKHRWGHNEQDIDLTWRYLKLAKRFRDEQISTLFKDSFARGSR